VVPAPPLEGQTRRNGFVAERKPLRTELAAQRNVDPDRHRVWKVYNPNRTTALGHFPGYALHPMGNALPGAHPDEALRHRAGFLTHHLWVTRQRPNEMYAAGDYVSQGAVGDGLPRWTKGNASLVNEDVVLWYTVGVTHVGRPEEWPVMPVARTGFRLMPEGFFTRNPALDVPLESK